MRAFDEPGNVDHDEGLLVRHPHDAELRLERGERIVGDFWTRGRDDGEQRRFSGVRKPDDAAVGQQAQLQPQREAFSRLALFGKPRRLPGAGREMLVAKAPAAALSDQNALARPAEVGEKPFRFAFGRAVDERSDGHGDDEVLAAAPGFVRRAARLAGVAREMTFEAELDEGRELRRRFEVDGAAVPAVAACGAALGDVLFTPPRDQAVTAVAGRDRDCGLVYELHASFMFPSKKQKGPGGPFKA